jgi:hypothetical protein
LSFQIVEFSQSISGIFYGIWKWVDNTPETIQNKTGMKRAPAFASKYSATEFDKTQKQIAHH